VKVLHRLNEGTDWAGKTLGGATNFAIGVAVNPVADDLDSEIERFHAKIDAGAAFRHDPPLFDPEHWYAFLKSSAANRRFRCSSVFGRSTATSKLCV